jgi:two-component system, cell cycle response regulator
MVDTILVIDDSPEIHSLVKARLGKEQVAILSAYDGESGLIAAREHRPDLILLDIDMPGRDGFEICVDLKSDSMTSNIPVIFLSAAASTSEKIRGLEVGATDYVTKPFDAAELLARVRVSLRTRRMVDSLSHKAMIDGLTGLWNRTYLEAHTTIELAAARRSAKPLACIMADVDHFKSVNDTYGHSFGDEVLREVGRVLTHSCRAEDIVCRYGGEEFTVLLPDTSLERAAELAERLRLAIEGRPFVCRDMPVNVTCSFGVANLRERIPPSVIELADAALYQAKRSGRNRVETCAQMAPCTTRAIV